MTRVLALDPGERVGWARADVSSDGQWTDLRHGITELRDMALAVHRSLVLPIFDPAKEEPPPDYDVVIVEDWRLYPGMAQQFVGSSFPAVRFIGAVQLCCWASGTKIVMQGARIKKPALQTMAKLRPELYELCTRPGAHDDTHDLDALMHLWFYTFKHCPLVGAKEAA